MGLATEITLAALEYRFEHLGMDEISATVRANHQASRHVLEKRVAFGGYVKRCA